MQSARENIDLLTGALQTFSRTTVGLQFAYKALERKIAALNVELEEANRNLSRSLVEASTLKDHLNSILESMTNGVIVIDPCGRITLFNKAAGEITGYRDKEVLGCLYQDLFSRGVEEKYTPLYALRTGIRVHERKEIVTRSGDKVPVEFSTAPITDAGEHVLGAVEMLQDLSELRDLEEEIEQTQTLAALGEMAASVAHEVRNPIGAIGGYAALLERDLEISDKRRDLVKKIMEGVARLDRIVTNLLTYTRPLTPNLREEDLKKIIQEALRFFQIGLDGKRENLRLVPVFRTKDLKAKIDPDLLQEALLNLFDNALHAMPDDGELRIETDLRTPKAEGGRVRGGVPLSPTLPLTPSGRGAEGGEKGRGKIEIKVSDTGRGMPEEVKKKLFSPFFTTRPDGIGLGLALVKKIVEMHKGEIHVDSVLGKGTTFTISLPVK